MAIFGRSAPQALFCLLCLSLAASMIWYTIIGNRGSKQRRWLLRLEPMAHALAYPPSAPAPSKRPPNRRGPTQACDGAVVCGAGGFRRFNDSGGGGGSGGEWRLCASGPWLPRSPCLAFAVGPDLAFDAAFAGAYSCQVFNFDAPEHRPAALGDGLWTLGRLNDTSGVGGGVGGRGGGFRRLLDRLGASGHVVELLRLRLRPGRSLGVADSAVVLADAVADGSLVNVKQLLLQADENADDDDDGGGSRLSSPMTNAPHVLDRRRHLLEATVDRLVGAGFCPTWLLSSGDAASLEDASAVTQQLRRPPLQRATLVNARFLKASARHRNPPGSQIARPLEKLGLVEPMKDD